MNKVDDTLKQMATLVQRNAANERDHTIAMYKIGQELRSTKYQLTMRQLAHVIGLPLVEISMAKTVAKRFPTIEELDNYCTHILKSWKWKDIKRKHSFKKSASEAKAKQVLYEMLATVKACIRERGSQSPVQQKEMFDELDLVRSSIARYLPAQRTALDENYLKYYECCCCGTYDPPPAGYDLTSLLLNTGRQIQYPICKACLENDNTVNYEILSTMYFNYALNLEEAYESLLLK